MASMARPLFRLGSVSSPCLRTRPNLSPTPPQLQGRRGGDSYTRWLSARSHLTPSAPRLSRDARPAFPTARHELSVLLHPRSARARWASHSPAAASFVQSISRRAYSSSAASSSTAEDSSSPATSKQSVRPEPPDYLDEKERAIFDRLNEALQPVALQVEDISGGCGSMYAVAITADKFKGLPVIKQHRLVNQVLGEDIKSWHGIQLRTQAP